jgi:hypothetical protein|tara:strand:- start:940 stop:1131 length:192 start_codon:yes stop_codon:yes gene_type:complete
MEHESGAVEYYGKQWSDRDPVSLGEDRRVVSKPVLIYEPSVRFPQEFRTGLDKDEFERVRRGM